jgi:L-asparaginase II
MYAAFAAAADGQNTKIDISASRTQMMARIFNAMSVHPELVAGNGRFCTALMEAYQGKLIGKVGADGCYGVGIRQSDRTRELGAGGALGIGVKVEDGDREILYSAVVEILEQLQIGTQETIRKLTSFQHPRRVNTMDVIVGGLSHRFRIQTAAS